MYRYIQVRLSVGSTGIAIVDGQRIVRRIYIQVEVYIDIYRHV